MKYQLDPSCVILSLILMTPIPSRRFLLRGGGICTQAMTAMLRVFVSLI